MNFAITNILVFFCLTCILAGCHPSPFQLTQTATIPEQLTSGTPLSYPTSSIQPSSTATLTLPPELTLTATKTLYNSVITHSMIFLNETVPDGSIYTPGEVFQKSWTLQNSGSASWGENFSLVVSKSIPATENLASPQAILLAKEVLPGENITLSVDLKAPLQEGQYAVYYQLQDENAIAIPNTQIWVMINVCESKDSCSATSLSGSTSTNGIDVSLISFTYNEQRATVNFCMGFPNRNYALDYAPALLIDEKPSSFLEGGSSSPWNCMQMVYQVTAEEIEKAQQIMLEINSSLRMSPPAGDPNVACNSARQDLLSQYSGLDFQCSFSMAGYYTNLKLPAELTREQADQIINDRIEGAIYGPWKIKIR